LLGEGGKRAAGEPCLKVKFGQIAYKELPQDD